MPDNKSAPDGSGGIRTGDVSGTVIVGDRNTVTNLSITATEGSAVTVHAGPLPDPVKRQRISHLPRPAADPLIGREGALRALQSAVGTRQLVQIWGPAGVGKSALLRHLARTLPGGADGAAYIEAGGRTADDLAQAIFDIGFEAPNYKPSLEVLKEHLKTLRLRIYLDDAGLAEKDLRRLFDMAEQSVFVFASRRRSAVGGVHAIPLDGLTSQAGVHLVQTVLARPLRPEEAQTLPALCDALHGNPLQLRRIALSVATGNRLPGIADLPALLPALLNRLGPAERDLLHLLGSLSGTELAAPQLNLLLGRTDAETLAEGLVRHGLLVASETGYGCPPDVAACVLKSRMTEFPAGPLCRALTAWVESRQTTPDQVAAHFQALDVAVLRAEQSGQARLGTALARAASPKLARSRQFDAWGSLLAAGWAAARTAGDSAGEAFFLREARARRKAIGRAAQTATLALEAGVLWQELTALHAHSAAHQAATAMATSAAPSMGIAPVTPMAPVAPVAPVAPAPTVVSPPTVTHPVVQPAPVTHPVVQPPTATHPMVQPAPVHPPASPQVIDLSHTSQQPVPGTHLTGTHSASQAAPPKIDLSGSHSSTAHSTHASHATHAAHSTHAAGAATTGTGHTALATAGAATAKGGIALAVACAVGMATVVGVGAVVNANRQRDPSPAATSGSVYADGRPYPSPVVTPRSIDTDNQPYPGPAVTPSSVDPVCATAMPDLAQEIGQYSTDHATAAGAIDAYNEAVSAHNSGQTTSTPDYSIVSSDLDTVLKDLRAIKSTVRTSVSQSRDGSVTSDLNGVLTSVQEIESKTRSYQSDPSATVEFSGQASALISALDSLQAHCGG
ncbi:ATP-binding protein [Kitasatospora sp. NPDC096077]|uniref:ATP-binding protein n=1 Tax=Kitasatospora sp. NPDC096077 TaxID=3155544 RepID=UPI003317E1D1